MAVLPALRAFGPAASGVLAPATQAEALLLWVLCLLPAWSYVSTPVDRRPPLPFLALFGVVFGTYFAFPLALGMTDLGGFGSYLREEDYAAAADAALLGWVGILAGFGLTRLAVRRPAVPEAPPMAPGVLMAWARRLAVGGVAFIILLDVVRVPGVFNSAVAFVGMLTHFGLALGVVLVVRGQARRSDVLILAGVTGCAGLRILVSGSLSGLLFLAATVGLAIWNGRGSFRVREVAAVGALLVLVVALKAVLPEFRANVWYGTQALTLSERVVLMQRLVRDQVEHGDEGILAQGTDRFSERSAVADLLADIIQRTPAEVPYWKGGSYVSLVGTLVPRILWPDKPEKDLGQRFGHRYEYIGAHDTGTSINFPWLVEFYANFGMGFMPVGGAILGSILALLGLVLNRPGQSVLTTAAGIALLVPLYNVESDFSLIYGGLILSGTALAIVMRYIGRSASAVNSYGEAEGRWVTA